ncbi:MAG: NFACT family protein, partial [Clostridia bacterium]|nr:NFACT family protein [Clostridia bacterium]
MAFDGIFLRHIINEISPCITGARVEKIHQPSREELVIHLRSKSGAYKLFLCVRASGPRVHFIEETPENPASPPMFCMLMRKKLTNSMLKDIRQSGLDRVVYFDFDAVNELGDRVTLTLSVEIMAKHSNIMLTDENGKIVDALRRIDFSRSEVRQILPGFPYTPPPAQDKLDLLTVETDEIIDRVKAYEFKAVSSALLNSVQGLSPLICRETALRCGEDIAVCDMNSSYESKLANEIERLKSICAHCSGQPYVLRDESGAPADFSFTEINQYSGKLISEKKDGFSAMLEDFYREKDRAERTRQKGHDLIKFLHNTIERTAKKLDLQRIELKKCADREELRISAELINANLYKLEKGSL